MWLTFTGEFSTLTADANQESYADNSNLKNLPKPKLVVKNVTYDKGAVTEDNLNDKIQKNKGDFIDLITEILDNIYKDQDIKDYEKKHPEYVFMELFDKLNSAQIE